MLTCHLIRVVRATPVLGLGGPVDFGVRILFILLIGWYEQEPVGYYVFRAGWTVVVNKEY